MDEYIEREKTVELLRSLGNREYRKEKGTIQYAIKMVSYPEYTPAADVAPVVHAHWQPYEDTVQCSACGFGTFMDGYFFVHGECTHADDRSFRFSFCPNCGAKMDEKVEE